MFAKSKRFQEVPKDDFPGPGEYNITVDELSRHKRYGFINQTLRFNDSPVEFPPDVFSPDNSTASLSSETQMSSGSTRRHVSEMALQFEKYRLSMQKEIDALQTKGRKLEANLQSAVADKESAHAALLNKDQELAELRLKNGSLQKALTRLEKNIDRSPKVLQLQKRVDQLENTLNTTRAAASAAQQQAQDEYAALQSTLAERDASIAQLQQQIQTQTDTIEHLDTQLREEKERLCHMEKEHQTSLASVNAELQTVTSELAERDQALREKSEQVSRMDDTIHQLQQQCDALQAQTSSLEKQMQHMVVQHKDEIDACHLANNHLKQTLEQLETTLQTKQQQQAALESHARSYQRETETLQEKLGQIQGTLDQKQHVCQQLQHQFRLYRTQVAHTIRTLREKLHANHDGYDSHTERLAAELLEAKKFINRQALDLDGLKSELHWMSKSNTLLWHIIDAMQQDGALQRCIMNMLTPSRNTQNTLTPHTVTPLLGIKPCIKGI